MNENERRSAMNRENIQNLNQSAGWTQSSPTSFVSSRGAFKRSASFLPASSNAAARNVVRRLSGHIGTLNRSTARVLGSLVCVGSFNGFGGVA